MLSYIAFALAAVTGAVANDSTAPNVVNILYQAAEIMKDTEILASIIDVVSKRRLGS